MPHKLFEKPVDALVRSRLKEMLKSGSMFSSHARGNKISITIPKVDVPSFVFGNNPCGEIPLGPQQECVLPVPENHKKRRLRSVDDDWMS